MSSQVLKKHIAETAYNVGYSAKLHFASFEMFEKLPGIISFISLAFGVYALGYIELSNRFTSTTLIVLGIIGVYISLKNNNDEDYENKGIILTDLFNELKHLMSEAKKDDSDIGMLSNTLKDIESRYNQNCASNHIMFASWLAHYKFFWEQQISWIEEYRNFSFWRDKIPLTLWFSIILVIIVIVIRCTNMMTYFC